MGKRWIAVWVLVIALEGGVSAQGLNQPFLTAYTGCGAYSAGHTDVFSFVTNQAALAGMKAASAAVFAERRFLLKGLDVLMGVMGVPTRSGNFGLKIGYAGFAGYNETQLGLAYGRKLGKLAIGCQFNYNGLRAAGYGSAAAVSVELGSLLHISERWHAGIHVNNPVGGRFGPDAIEKLPAVYSFGLGYEPSVKFFSSMRIVKEEGRDLNVIAAMQYKVLSRLAIRAGIATQTSTPWWGAGFWWGSIRLDVIAAHHPQLGVTPGVLLLFNFQTEDE